MARKNTPTADDVRRIARDRVERQESRGSNPFWDLVNEGEEIWLPKPHLTQPDVVARIEAGMEAMDEKGRWGAFQQVLTGVVEGRFSQYAVLPFGHYSVFTVKKDGEVVKNDDGSDRTGNNTAIAKRLMSVIDAIIVEMPEDSEHRERNDKYATAAESVRDEETGRVDDDRLAQLILEADKAGDPFWTDSREFIQNGEVEGSAMSLLDLATAGVISVRETERGGSKVFIAKRDDLPSAIDNLSEAGFEAGAELLRKRTQRRKSGTKLGSGLSALVGVGADTKDDAEDTEES